MLLRCLKQNILPLCLAAALLALAACGQRGEAPEATAPPWQPEALPAIAGEESAAPAAPSGTPDGLEGSYYNDFLRETLVLDGFGSCAISWDGGVMSGSYDRLDGGDLLVRISDLSLTVRVDAGGNLGIDGREGRFLRDWDFWGITPAEAGVHPVNTLPDTEDFPLGGGAYRYRDFPAGIALSYDEAYQVLAGRLDGAVCVADGKGGYVVGRNVTQRWAKRSGSASEFLEDCIRGALFSDCAALYAPVEAYDGLRLLAGEKDGYLAAAELTLSCGGQEIAARLLLYPSAFPDGAEDVVCKCLLAPAGEPARLDALARGVYDVGAARLVQGG